MHGGIELVRREPETSEAEGPDNSGRVNDVWANRRAGQGKAESARIIEIFPRDAMWKEQRDSGYVNGAMQSAGRESREE